MTTRDSTQEDTAEGRLITGAKSLGMIDRKPLFGWGYGRYDFFDENFRVQIGNIVNENDKTSHNTFLTVMAEQGIPALLLYLFPTGVLAADESCRPPQSASPRLLESHAPDFALAADP